MCSGLKSQGVYSTCYSAVVLLCQDPYTGNVLKRGISGGQAKRVNIALSLITQPLILCLDEPTSGLDSHNALEVINIMKQEARKGMTILATIH